MSFDVSNLGVSGGVVIACALYAGASLLGGQVIGERMIARSDWQTRCEEQIVEAIPLPEPAARKIPAQRCTDVFAGMGPDARMLCGIFGNFDLNAEARRLAEDTYARKKSVAESRRKQAARNAGSKCACARDVYLSDNLLILGLLAGSGRLVSMPSVNDLDAGLQRSLAGATCQAMGGAS